MRRLAPARLRWRLALVTVALIAAALASVGVAQYVILRGYLLDRTYQVTYEQAAIMLKQNQNSTVGVRIPGSVIALYTANGQQTTPPDASSNVPKPGAPTPGWIEPSSAQVRSLISPMLGPKVKGGPRYAVLGTPPDEAMVMAFPMQLDQFLVVETPLNEVDRLLAKDVVTFAAAAAGALLAAAALAVWLTGRALRPLERVAVVAREVSGGAYGRRTGLRGAGEVASVGAAFDEMVDRLQEQIRQERESEARMRRFLADASHELRTPVTGILGHLEVLRRGAVENRADREESLAAMHGAAERMARLVADLLTLARFEETEARLRPEPVSVEELLWAATGGAVTNGHRLSVEPVPPGLAALADRDATERILVNLLDNAAKYSPPGTSVELAGRTAAEGWVELVVADHGPGIRPEERERIFERLYRGDRSRANGTVPGAGLGLAICRALARGQGGDVTVRETPGGGATFAVKLPCRRAAS